MPVPAREWETARLVARPAVVADAPTCDVDNIASARVLERVGMQREGVLRDAFCYAIVKGS
jgi:hypothetical protein